MADFYKRNRKKLIFVTFLFLLFFGGWWNLKYNLPKTVEVVVRLFLGPTFKSSSIDFEKNRIVIKNFVLADGEEVIIDTPRVDILYSPESLKAMRVEEIIVNGGVANITRRENGDINIVAAFTGGTKPEDENKKENKEESEPYTPGISIPIDKITGVDVTTVYRDLGYRLPIEQTAYNTNGYLTFSKTTGIDLHFVGNNDKEIYDFAFSTAKEPYSMTIKLSNIGVKTELAQYGYDGKEVSYDGGELNMDLTIASSGMAGWIKFDGVNVRYIDLDDTIEDVSGRVDFKKEGIFLDALGKVFGKPEEFTLSYKDSELNIDFDLENIEKKNIEKLSYLKGIELPFEELNVDSVKFNLNMKGELKITIDTLVKKAEMQGLRLNNTVVQLLYDKDGIHLPIISTTLNTIDSKGNIGIQEKVDGALNFVNSKGDLTFDIKNSNGKNFIPNLKGKLDFEILEKEIKLALASNIIDLKGSYLTEAKKFQLKEEGSYYLGYDLNSKKLDNGEGVIGFSLFDFDFSLDYKVQNNVFTLNSLALLDEGEKEIYIDGELDLNSLNYLFKLKSNNFDIERKIAEDDLEIMANLSGEIQGSREKFSGTVDVASLSGKYLGKIENLKGKIIFNNEKNMFFQYEGEIDKLSYKDYSLNGIAISTRLKDSIFEIRNINNQLFKIDGEYSLEDSTIRGRLETNKLSLTKFNIEFPEIKLNRIVGDIRGDIKNPSINVDIEDLGIGFKNSQDVKIIGKLLYRDGVLTTEDVKVNQSILKGRYSTKDGKYSAKMNIIEENIGRYYNYESLKYRVIGVLEVKGEGKKIGVDFKSTVDKIYLNGTIFPTLYIESNYLADNLTDGVFTLKKATLSNSDLEDLFTIVGNYNLSDGELNVKVDKQKLPMTKLRQYIPVKELGGTLLLDGVLSGKLEDLKYNFSITSDSILIEGIDFKNLKFLLLGDTEKLQLKEFSLGYLGNSFTSNGGYDILTKDYWYFANSPQINMEFLNIFLERYGISDIGGEAEFDLKIKSGKTTGFFNLKNFNLENKDFFLKLERFNSTIRLENNKIVIRKFNGKLNDGDIDLVGEITVPELKEISENPYYYENIKYNGNLKLNNIQYKYGNYFNVDFDADIGVRDKEIVGTLDIKRGQVNEIPNTSKSIFQKIKEFLFSSTSKTINQSEDLGSDFKIESIIENAPVINLKLGIEDGIKLDIESLNSFVENVKGSVVGNGVLSGRDGKYTFIGNVEVLGGSLDLNDNTFLLDRAVVIFNDQKAYLPTINPNLLIDATVDVQDERIGLSLNGQLDDLKFTISSKNGSSSGNLNALLTDTESMGENSEATTTLITNVIGGQLTQVLKPISNLVKNTLSISKFRISSNLLTQETKTNVNDTEKTQSNLRLGAVLEAEDNIYKDKIWWVARGTLLEEDNTESNKRNSDSGAFKEYDFSLEYRFDATKSIGIGVGKLPEERKKSSDEDSKGDLNYHIDFKFEKKYDKLIDIFINK